VQPRHRWASSLAPLSYTITAVYVVTTLPPWSVRGPARYPAARVLPAWAREIRIWPNSRFKVIIQIVGDQGQLPRWIPDERGERLGN
jgi:hypothetical protein